MKVEIHKCDACGKALREEDASRERCFELRTPFRARELDLCRDCWTKMCVAVGLDPDIKE